MYREPGGEVVEQAIQAGAAVSTVNLSEVAAKLCENGLNDAAAREAISELDIQVVAFGFESAFQAGALRLNTKRAGLSLGDRACLALAQQLGVPAITADRAWARLSLDIPIHVIR
jgi:PIN domain nuclease of toxin-antitoxin system